MELFCISRGCCRNWPAGFRSETLRLFFARCCPCTTGLEIAVLTQLWFIEVLHLPLMQRVFALFCFIFTKLPGRVAFLTLQWRKLPLRMSSVFSVTQVLEDRAMTRCTFAHCLHASVNCSGTHSLCRPALGLCFRHGRGQGGGQAALCHDSVSLAFTSLHSWWRILFTLIGQSDNLS